jgi:hypothetical protein
VRHLPMLILLAAAVPADAVEISNHRAGLACMNSQLPGRSEAGWICQPTSEILVTDHGICVYNGEKKRCTWLGFEFDYSGASEGETLHCVSESSLPVDSGNPKGIVAEDITSESYEIPLQAGSGHVFNPQYFIFTARRLGADDAILEQRTRCGAGGETLFEHTFKVVFPLVPEPGP